MEVISNYENGGPRVIIDYAHTPDALENSLVALRSHCRNLFGLCSVAVVIGIKEKDLKWVKSLRNMQTILYSQMITPELNHKSAS